MQCAWIRRFSVRRCFMCKSYLLKFHELDPMCVLLRPDKHVECVILSPLPIKSLHYLHPFLLGRAVFHIIIQLSTTCFRAHPKGLPNWSKTPWRFSISSNSLAQVGKWWKNKTNKQKKVAKQLAILCPSHLFWEFHIWCTNWALEKNRQWLKTFMSWSKANISVMLETGV